MDKITNTSDQRAKENYEYLIGYFRTSADESGLKNIYANILEAYKESRDRECIMLSNALNEERKKNRQCQAVVRD